MISELGKLDKLSPSQRNELMKSFYLYDFHKTFLKNANKYIQNKEIEEALKKSDTSKIMSISSRIKLYLDYLRDVDRGWKHKSVPKSVPMSIDLSPLKYITNSQRDK